MNLDVSLIIRDYLYNQKTVFTADDFYKYLRRKNIHLTKEEVISVLQSSELVFSLVNNEYITRAGAFTGRVFSFKPTLEEVKKGHFVLGHRCMPFINPEISPDSITVCVGGRAFPPEATRFSMNLALDLFALYGEGYSLSYVFNDQANDEYTIASLAQFDLPNSINLTSWPFSIFGDDVKVEYGDRIFCYVKDWATSFVEVELIKQNQNPLSVSMDDVEREEWYSIYEKLLLESFEKNGPANSIEEQLAFLFLENNSELCIASCGSSEEFLQHTDKVQFQPFGVESRLWRKGEVIPFSGRWNSGFTNETLFSEISQIFSPSILDAYITRSVGKEIESNKAFSPEALENLEYEVFPSTLDLSPFERKTLLLNIKKRRDIIFKEYSKEKESKISPLRDKTLNLFSDVSSLMCEICCNCETYEDFSQQDIVILTQLFSHLVSLIEEIQNPFARNQFPIDDTLVSLDGMIETFGEINYPLRKTLKKIIYNKVDIKKKIDSQNMNVEK